MTHRILYKESYLKFISVVGRKEAHVIGINWFIPGFQYVNKVVAALISVGIVTAMEYQKFHLREH